MSSPIWQKQSPVTINKQIMDFMAGEDVILDRELFLFDIEATQAHVKGLYSIEILSEDETSQLLKHLELLAEEFIEGRFILDHRFEDCHSAIEYYLVEKLGDTGKRVHTGRSRNDQILVATRLYLKSSLQQMGEYCREAAEQCLSQAKKHQTMPMPGYTHLQQAVVSSVGMWFAGFAEAMIDNLSLIKSVQNWVDANPLGTAAGYGVNLPLNRQLTTEELGFSRLQINPIYAQNSRGKFELETLSALSQCLLDIRRYSWDLSLFTTAEFNFVELPDEMTTGSSIMPNKRNPDLIELMRGSYAVVQGGVVELQSLLSLPSGYQRDLQFSKAPLLRSMKRGLDTLALFPEVIGNTQFIEDNLRAAIKTPMYATDLAIELSASGMPFRDAYQQVVKRYSELEQRTPEQSIKQRISPGACADLMLDVLQQRLKTLA